MKTLENYSFYKTEPYAEERRLDGCLTHSVNERVNSNTLVLVFKMKNGMVPNNMQDLSNLPEMQLPERYEKQTNAAAVKEDEHAKHDLV
jgi:hypothetical protein